MLLFETLLVRGGYNSGVALKWPRVQQPSSISNILQGSEIRLLVFFPHSALAVPILPFILFLLILRLCLFLYLSVYPCRSRLFFAVASSQSSFMPLGGEDLITHGEWILPVLPVLKVRAAAWNSRCLTLLDTSPFFIILFYFDHLLPFLKSLFTRHASEIVKKTTVRLMIKHMHDCVTCMSHVWI